MFNTQPMVGSSGHSPYSLVAVFPNARLGYRDLGGSVRVRVEPVNDAKFTFPSGWSQPYNGDLTQRYSTVVKASDKNAALAHATLIILGLSLESAKIVPTYKSL